MYKQKSQTYTRTYTIGIEFDDAMFMDNFKNVYIVQ